MTRKTSIEAYKQIRDSGLLSERRFEVYDVVFRHGPLTANEAFKILYDNDMGAKNAASNSAARFSELRDVGVLYEVGERKCGVTGMKVIVWDVTDQLPKAPDKKPTRKEKKEELLAYIVSVGKEIDEVWKDDLRKIYALAKLI